MPEGHASRFPRSRGDDHPIAGDLLDAPGGGTEEEGVPGAGLVDHLLVQLADARAAAGEEDAEGTAVGNRAPVHAGEHGRASARADQVAGSIPAQARTQLGEVAAGKAPGQHVEHRVQGVGRQLAIRIGAAHQGLDRADLPRGIAAQGDDLLREHVEGVLRNADGLDRAGVHVVGDDRGLEQVAAELRKDAALAGRADVVTGATDPLQTARDRAGGFDLQHEVDRAHVDAQLEGAGGDDAADQPLFQTVLDLGALLMRDTAVVGEHELFPRQIVQPLRESFAEAAAVDEDDRRTVGADLLEQGRVDGGPDAPFRRSLGGFVPIRLG